MSLRLPELAVGDHGRILGFEAGHRDYRQRLLAMGLTPGTEFVVARLAPLGDPVEVRVRGSSVSLRKGEAAVLRVEKLT